MEPVFPWSMSDFKPGEGILCAESGCTASRACPTGALCRKLAIYSRSMPSVMLKPVRSLPVQAPVF